MKTLTCTLNGITGVLHARDRSEVFPVKMRLFGPGGRFLLVGHPNKRKSHRQILFSLS